MWDLTDKPRVVHSMGNFSRTSCGKLWSTSKGPGGDTYGYIPGTRDLVKNRAALTTCPECLKVLKRKRIL